MMISASNNPCVVLINMDVISKREITGVLNELGCAVGSYNLEQFLEMEVGINPCLIIVNLSGGSCHIINSIKKNVYRLCPSIDSKNLSIIALVDEAMVNKEKLYLWGASDYISTPVIPAEIKKRIDQTLFRTDADNFDLLDVSPPNLLHQSMHALESIYGAQKSSAERELAQRTARYLESNIDTEISLAALSQFMATNRNKLSRVFKQCFGSSIYTWLREKRMAHAAELLKETDKSIQEIAFCVGYQDSNNFSTAFKRCFTLSPIQYRKSIGCLAAAKDETLI